MNVRVTSQSQANNAIMYMQQESVALAKYQDQTSSGLRVKLPSDDPTRYPALARAKADSAWFDTYAATMSASTTTLNAGVSSLLEVNKVLTQAKQIAIEGASANTDQQGAEALATQVDGLIDRVLKTGNISQDGRYVFAGTATGTPPFRVATVDAAGRPATIAYDGSADRARTVIGPGQTVETRYAGDQVFQRSGADVFETLIGLRDQLRNTTLTPGAKSQALSQQIGTVDAALSAIGDTTAEQSSNLANLQALQSRVQDLKLTADARAGEIEGTDYAEAIVKMRQQETALQATMSVSAKLLQPSLLDFIR